MTGLQRMCDILEMLTIDDAARILGVSVSDIRVLVDTDQLLHYRLGQYGEQIQIIRRDLMAFKAKAQRTRQSVDDSWAE